MLTLVLRVQKQWGENSWKVAECESRQGHMVVPCASLTAFREQPASFKNVPEEALKITFMKSPHLGMVF